MYYMEFLCVRKTLYWLAGLLATAVGIVSWVIASNGHGIPHHVGVVPVAALMAGATFVSAIIAMIFACALARQNDGHLPLVWTRPVSREKYIFTVTAVHIAGIAIAFLMTLAAALSVFAIFGALDALTMGGAAPADSGTLSRMAFFPLAWYGLVIAITASVRGGAGFMAFGAWIVGSALLAFDQSHLFGGVSGIVLNVIDHINPLYYFSSHFDENGANKSMVANVDVAILGLSAIAVAGYAAAIAQWRRLEA